MTRRTMAEEIYDTPENIERAVGEASTARAISLDSFVGLGPPDMVCTQKLFTRAWLPGDMADLPRTGCVCLNAGKHLC